MQIGLVNVRRLKSFVRPYVKHVILAVFFMVASTLLGLYIPWMAKDLLRPIINKGNLRELTFVSLNIIGVTFLSGLAYFGQVYYSNKAGQKIIVDLRMALYRHMQRLPLSFYDNAQTGQLMSRITNDMFVLQSVLSLGIFDLIAVPLTVLVGLFAMFKLSWQLSLLAIFGAPLIGCTIGVAGRKVRNITIQVQVKIADIVTHLQQTLSSIRIVQCFTMEPQEIEKFSMVNQSFYRFGMHVAKIQGTMEPLVDLLGTIGLVLVLWFGGRLAIQHKMPVENLFAILWFAQSVGARFKTVGRINITMQQADAAAGRMFEILDIVPEIQDAPDAVELPRSKGYVAFEDVSFTYATGDEVLNHVSFEIRPGEVVAIVGPSGAGKTTISNLIPRLYDPTDGAITIDGHDIRKVTLFSLRSQIGIVPQETVLFSGTIRENVAYGKPDAPEEEVIEAAKRANAHQFICDLPEGYETLVGERGVKLSGGQRQRVAIARALLKDPRILILDEATSSLDTASEAAVQEALDVLMKNRTTLVIAHRLSTIRNANRILVMHKGRIEEQGSHEQLMAMKGLYSRLYEVQSKGDTPLEI